MEAHFLSSTFVTVVVAVVVVVVVVVVAAAAADAVVQTRPAFGVLFPLYYKKGPIMNKNDSLTAFL